MSRKVLSNFQILGLFGLPALNPGTLKVAPNGDVYTDGSQTLDVTDYDYDIIGTHNGVNQVFKLRYAYVPDTTKVYLNGVRLTLGANYDYDEISTDEIQIFLPPEAGDLITVDYKVLIP